MPKVKAQPCEALDTQPQSLSCVTSSTHSAVPAVPMILMSEPTGPLWDILATLGEFFVESGDARSPTGPCDPFGGADLGDVAR
jgi:hypothetical protein